MPLLVLLLLCCEVCVCCRDSVGKLLVPILIMLVAEPLMHPLVCQAYCCRPANTHVSTGSSAQACQCRSWQIDRSHDLSAVPILTWCRTVCKHVTWHSTAWAPRSGTQASVQGDAGRHVHTAYHSSELSVLVVSISAKGSSTRGVGLP